MAQKKSGGSSRNGRESKPKFLGFKKKIKDFLKPGDIIIKQKGNKYFSGLNTSIGRDYTIFSKSYGYLNIISKKKKKILYVL